MKKAKEQAFNSCVVYELSSLIQQESIALTLGQGFTIINTPVLPAAGPLSCTNVFQSKAQLHFYSFKLPHIAYNWQRCYD